MSKSGEGEYVPSPRPNPRLRPEGAAYAERNRGTMERWFDYSDTLNDNKKASGGAGGDNHAVVAAASHGALDEGLGGGGPETPPSRGGGEGLVGATDSQADLTQKCSQLSLSSSVRGPTEEAKEYAQRNRGTMDHIINNYGAASPTLPPPQEVPPSLTQSQTTEMAPPLSPPTNSARRSLHMESQGMAWDETRPGPRIRAEGESIAMKNSRDSMFDIMSSENASSPEDSPVKGPHSSRHSQESVGTSQSASQPRARPGDGMKNYARAHDQSEMAAILRGEVNEQPSNQARNIRHLQRSELW